MSIIEKNNFSNYGHYGMVKNKIIVFRNNLIAFSVKVAMSTKLLSVAPRKFPRNVKIEDQWLQFFTCKAMYLNTKRSMVNRKWSEVTSFADTFLVISSVIYSFLEFRLDYRPLIAYGLVGLYVSISWNLSKSLSVSLFVAFRLHYRENWFFVCSISWNVVLNILGLWWALSVIYVICKLNLCK